MATRQTTERSRLLSAAAVGLAVLAGAVAAVLVGRSQGAASWTPPGTVLASFDFEDGEGRTQHRLPGRLQEISGLARVSGEALSGHGDERARIHRIDPGSGQVLEEFRLGENGVRGDFEGIAALGSTVFLTDSDGLVFASPEGEADARVSYKRLDTGIGARCEVEGLAAIRDPDRLLLACKSRRDRELVGGVTVFSVGLEDANDPAEVTSGPPELLLDLPPAALEEVGLPRRLSVSGLEVHPETGRLVLVASREGRIVEMTRDGEILAWARLRSGPHRQPEGITFTADGGLAIADEGGGGAARLTIYDPSRPPPEEGL
jgi:hypothetical protein